MLRNIFSVAVVVAAAAIATAQSQPVPDPLPDTTSAAPSRAELDALLEETDAIAQTVSKLRGLPLKKPIVRGVKSRADIEKRLLKRLDAEYSAAELAEESRAMKRLGLLPPDADYKKILVDLLTDQIAGFYDLRARELYLADWTDAASQRMIMAHEIDHALQDQSFDLGVYVHRIKGNTDAEIARQAVVEGDGLALMIEFVGAEQQVKTTPWADPAIVQSIIASTRTAATTGEFGKAPLVIRESLLFPYTAGLQLVAAIRKTHAWGNVDELFLKPPTSSEQVLHPEKYAAGEQPRNVATAPLPSLAAYKETYANVLGELVLGIFFEQHGTPRDLAQRAAAGWGGDRFVVFAPRTDGGTPDEAIGLGMSAWDSKADAVEAFAATADALLRLSGATIPRVDRTGYREVAGRAGETSLVERKGKVVVVVLGAPPTLAQSIRAELWARWKVE